MLLTFLLVLSCVHVLSAEEEQTTSVRKTTPVATESGTPDSAERSTSKQQPVEEAPSLGGPSGPLPATGTPQPAPTGGSEEEQPAPDVEAPSLGAPSGGEQRPPEEGGGRFAPWWTRVPNVQPFPPPGNTIVPPRGSGYYTFLELLRRDRREAAPKYPYPRFAIMQFSFYNTDWRYLDSTEGREQDSFDFLKRRRSDARRSQRPGRY